MGSTPKTPEKTAKPAASADPTYPGAAGIRKVKAAKAVPKTTLIKLKSTPKAVNTVSQIAASENVARNLREIASPKHYKGGVNVFNFDDFKPIKEKVETEGGIKTGLLNFKRKVTREK